MQLRRDKSRINNNSMSLRAAVLIYLLLLVDKADSKKGELQFFILIEQGLYLMEVLYLAGAALCYIESSWICVVQRKLVIQCQRGEVFFVSKRIK